MKATGVIRRIDDLGRIVIPKEIRKVLMMKRRSHFMKEQTDLDLTVSLIKQQQFMSKS